MHKKLSQKEREEPVTKGFFEDHLEYMLNKQGYVTEEFLIGHGYITQIYFDEVLESKKYITKDFLESKNYVASEHIEKKNYTTKEYSHDMFDYYQSDMKHHIDSLVERQHDFFRGIIETLEGRFERNETHLDNHDDRLNALEIKASY